MNAILERIKKAYRLETDAEVADFLDIKPSTLSMQKNRGRLDLKRIIKKCSDLNKNWLLDGVGEVRLNSEHFISIPIYKKLETMGAKLNLKDSHQVGSLKADLNESLESNFLADNLIGYLAKENSLAPAVKKNDVAIVNLNNQLADNSIVLLRSEENIVLRRITNHNGQYVVKNVESTKEMKKVGGDGCYSCIGNVISVLRKV